jgi:hypothetical protein
MAGGLGGILTRVEAAGMRSWSLIFIIMACVVPIGGRMDHPVVASHAHVSATQTAMPLWGRCATLRTRRMREDAGETWVMQAAFVDGSDGRCLGGNSWMPGTAVMCLRGGGRARRAEEREEAKVGCMPPKTIRQARRMMRMRRKRGRRRRRRRT